jgi:hypothetical protein
MSKLEYSVDGLLDMIAISSAIKSTNIPQFGSVCMLEGKLLVLAKDGVGFSVEQVEAIGEIIDAHRATFDWILVRSERELLFAEADWRIRRALDEGEDATQLIEYRRALRDITKQESPDTVVWPTKPW